MAKLHEVHQSRQRIHVMEKMNGCAIYGADLHLPHMLYAKGVVTGCPYGEIRAIHTEEALNIPGVRGVYTAEDIPGHNGFGAFCKDEPILAERYVKFAGDVVAVVVADSPVLAEQGAKGVGMDGSIFCRDFPWQSFRGRWKAEGFCINNQASPR